MPSFYLPDPGPPRPRQPDPTELAGADVDFTGGGMHVVNGDWATISGDAVVRQSVIRTAVAAPGSLVRRPSWGAGGSASIFQAANQSGVSKLVAAQRASLQSNPRVQRVINVSTQKLTSTGSGRAIVLEYLPVGSQDTTRAVIEPKR